MFRVGLLICCLMFLPVSAQAASKHFLAANTFNVAGVLKNDLQVEFSPGYTPEIILKKLKTPKAETFLVVGVWQQNNSLFLQHIFGSENYLVYNLKLRDAEHEDLVIIGYEEKGNSKQLLKTISIIGENQAGNLAVLKLVNFAETEVMKMPLQLNEKSEIIMNLASNAAEIKIFWDSAKQNFVFAK